MKISFRFVIMFFLIGFFSLYAVVWAMFQFLSFDMTLFCTIFFSVFYFLILPILARKQKLESNTAWFVIIGFVIILLEAVFLPFYLNDKFLTENGISTQATITDLSTYIDPKYRTTHYNLTLQFEDKGKVCKEEINIHKGHRELGLHQKINIVYVAFNPKIFEVKD